MRVVRRVLQFCVVVCFHHAPVGRTWYKQQDPCQGMSSRNKLRITGRSMQWLAAGMSSISEPHNPQHPSAATANLSLFPFVFCGFAFLSPVSGSQDFMCEVSIAAPPQAKHCMCWRVGLSLRDVGAPNSSKCC
eukprot:2969143-Amphidinium_carterae.1